jgi:hypothetical protein
VNPAPDGRKRRGLTLERRRMRCITAATDRETAMAIARIYRPAKTAMQSGKAKSRDWRLEFEPASARTIDPLMGWTSSSDMNGQVRLTFDSKDEAVAYAERHGIAFRLHEPQEAPVIIKAYADNFSTYRKQSWTH